jgi:hypothetical protein
MSELRLATYGMYDPYENPKTHGLVKQGGAVKYPDRGQSYLGPGINGVEHSFPYAVPLCLTENYLLCTRGRGIDYLQPGGAIYFAPLRDEYTGHEQNPSTQGVYGALEFPVSTGPITSDWIDGAETTHHWPVAMWLEGDKVLVLARGENEKIVLALCEPGMAPKVARASVEYGFHSIPSGIGIDADGNIRVAVSNGLTASWVGVEVIATSVRVSSPINIADLAVSPAVLEFPGSQVSLRSDKWRATGTVAAIASAFGGNFVKAIAYGPNQSRQYSESSNYYCTSVLQVLATPITHGTIRVHTLRPYSISTGERPAWYGDETELEPVSYEVCAVDISYRTDGSFPGYMDLPDLEDYGETLWNPRAEMQGAWPSYYYEPTFVSIDIPTEAKERSAFWTRIKRSVEVI